MDADELRHPFLEVLDRDFMLICAAAEAPPTARELNQLERRVGRKLPADFRDFLAHFGGTVLEVRERVWPPPEPLAIQPAWHLMSGWYVFGIGPEIPDWLHLANVTHEFHRTFPQSKPYLPFFQVVSTADYACFGPDDRIYWWREGRGMDESPVNESFDEFLVRETRALFERKERLKRERAAKRARGRKGSSPAVPIGTRPSTVHGRLRRRRN